MRNLLLILICCGITMHDAFAGARQTPEAVVVSHITNAISAYSKGYGRMPSTWEELGQIIILETENKAMSGTYGYRIQDRYQFIAQPMAVPADEDLNYLGTQVLLIRTVPLKNTRDDTGKTSLQRYLVYQNKAGNILSMNMPEEKVQAMLAKSGVRLISPQGAPATESDEVAPRPEKGASEPDQSDLPGKPKAPSTIPSPVPRSPVVQTPAAVSDHSASVWPWVVGAILAIVLVGALALKRRV